jgi:esterase/lipase superfamily enzyme
MSARILLLLVLLGGAAGAANAQSAPAPDQAATAARPAAPRPRGPCGVKAGEGLPALEKRKEILERRVALARTARRAPAGGEAAKGGGGVAKAKAKSVTKTQAALLEVLFQIQCLQLRQQAAARADVAPPAREPPSAEPVSDERLPAERAPETRAPARLPAPEVAQPVEPPGPAPAHPKFSTRRVVSPPGPRSGPAPSPARSPGTADAIAVTTYFATNRGWSGGSDPARLYSARPAALSYGRALVTIPKTHTPGHLEQPSIWKLQFHADPRRHFVLKSVARLKTDEARWQMAKALEGVSPKALLIFVHGYNMSFAEAAMRTAQLAYDLDFPGVPFFFSWPSVGQVTGYVRDGETAVLSQDAFDRVLDDLSELPVSDIYLIAHSMGSRIVSEVLRGRVERGKDTARISELLLAAPDINAEIFRTRIAPRLAEMRRTQTTVYASSSDLALIASKAVTGYQRVGETAGGVFVYPGLETIDASRASVVMREFGHSYLTDSAAVLKDIRSLLLLKLPAKARGLSQAGISPNLYWSLQ